MISFPYNFFFFNSNHALLSSKKTEKSTKLSFKKEIGTFDARFWQNDGRYTRVFAKKIIEIIILSKTWSKNGLLYRKIVYQACRFFGSFFGLFFCKNVLIIWHICCSILAKCWSIYQGICKNINRNYFFVKKAVEKWSIIM